MPDDLLTLSGIGVLAAVRRPVVTTWRARHRDGARPFPEPVAVDGRQELFDSEQVVEWLESTGCGNNPDARLDVGTCSSTAVRAVADATVFGGLTALLCLRTAAGPLPVEPDQLLDVADGFDSDDQLLLGELEAIGPQLPALTRYAELLVATAFDPAEPFDELVRRRQVQLNHPPVHASLRRLVARTAVTLADEAGFSDPVLVVRSPTDLDLVLEAEAQTERRGTLSVAVVADGHHDTDLRLGRRWLRVHGLDSTELEVDVDGSFALPDQGVLVLRLPTATNDRAADLDLVSNACLDLSWPNRAVVVGPSASLVDPLVAPRRPGRPTADGTTLSAAGTSRADALRTGLVRAVIRLPAGLFPDQSRTRAALWCVGPSPASPATTLCADVTHALDEARTDDLVTDLYAAMQGAGSERARQLSSSAFWPTSALSISTRALVSPTVREVHVGPSSVVADLEEVLDRAATDVRGIARPGLVVTGRAAALPRVSLEAALQKRGITLLTGARVPASDRSPKGGVPVVEHPADLARREHLTGLSVLRLATAYPHVDVTRPGDVVVTTKGGPAAAVDHLGGVVVAYPARVLRCHRPRTSTEQERKVLADRGQWLPELAAQTFTPEAVAADINAQPASATTWRAWPLTVLPTDQLAGAERLLDALAQRRTQLDAARADIDTAICAITASLGAQICTVVPSGSAPTSERTDT